MDPDPDPYQNFMDLQHCYNRKGEITDLLPGEAGEDRNEEPHIGHTVSVQLPKKIEQ